MNYSEKNVKNFSISNSKKFFKKEFKNCLFRSFSYTNLRKYKIKNGKLTLNNKLPSFFDITSCKIIEELEKEITFNSDLNNKSYDFIQKYSLNLNDTNMNNRIYNKNRNLYNDVNNFWNSDINSYNYFDSRNKNELNNFFSNSEINHYFGNILNDNHKNIKCIQSQKENIDIEGIYKLKKENLFNNISKTKSKFNYNDLIIENSHFSYKNKYINSYENNKERKVINADNILITKNDESKNFNEDIVEFKDEYKFNSVQNNEKGHLNNTKYLHSNKINSFVNSHKFDGFQESNTNKNNDIYSINNNNINISNNNKIYYNNYINLINPIIPNNQKDETLQLNEKKKIFSVNYTTNNNNSYIEFVRQYLNPNDYLIEMYGKLGWICYICDNFNYEPRKQCNRCKAIKLPKIKEEIYIKKKKTKKEKNLQQNWKVDWFCLNCKNLNYGFRKFCNKCKTQRQKISPSIFLKPNQKLKGNEVI